MPAGPVPGTAVPGSARTPGPLSPGLPPRPGLLYLEAPAAPRTTVASAAPLSGVPVSVTLADSAQPIQVVPVGVSAAGVLVPPENASTVGWWVAGPRPGGPGRTVITGHIDSQATGLGAFAALNELRPAIRSC